MPTIRWTSRTALAAAVAAVLLAAAAGCAGDKPARPAPAAASASRDRTPCGLKAGDRAPDGVTLLDADGLPVALADMYAQGPLVVTFYRGEWCPFCTRALSAWRDRMSELKDAGGTLIAISPEAPPFGKKTIEKTGASCTVLCDHEMQAARAFRVWFELDAATVEKYKGYGVDLARRNANGTPELPAPATFVIDRTGVVRYAFADWDYRERADPAVVIAAVRALKQ